MTLVEQIKALYPQLTNVDFLTNIQIKDNLDGNGPFIAIWNVKLDEPTPEQLANAQLPLTFVENAVVELVQKMLDDFAATRRYNSIMSACTYVNSNIPQFKLEGDYCVKARDEHWAVCYQILGEVLQGLRPNPTVDEVVAELPVLQWPDDTAARTIVSI